MELKKEIDVFAILEVSETSTKDEIRKAYLKLAKQYHPDKFKDDNDKLEAEKKFKIIKKAYDNILEKFDFTEDFLNEEAFNSTNNSFSDFFASDKYEQIDDVYEDDVEFIKYYINNVLKNKDKHKTTDNIRERLINDVKEYIEKNQIDEETIFDSIKNNKLIIKTNINDLTESKNNIIKETIYRTHIKNSDRYKSYLKHSIFNNNLDVNMDFIINESYIEKDFNQTINYKIFKLCEKCNGCGCENCELGFITKEKKARIKLDKIENKNYILVIKSGGCEGMFHTGKLNISVKIDKKNSLSDIDFNFRVKYKYDIKKLTKHESINNNIKKINTSITKSFQTIHKKLLETAQLTNIKTKEIVEFLKKHKIHVGYVSLVLILLIIIIILAIL